MTVEEIHLQLKLVSKDELLKFKTDLESDTTQFIKTYNNPSNALHVLGHAIIKALSSSRSSFPIPNWETRVTYFFYDNRTLGIPRCNSIISNSLPIEIWPYLPKTIKTRLQKAKQDQDRQASTKDIKLDLMSFMMFKSHLSSQKKKMSSAFALDQLGKLFKLFNSIPDPKQFEIAANYISLIWEYTPVKSVNLCSYLINKNYKIAYLPYQHLPFQIVSYDWSKDPLEATLKQAEFAPVGVIPFIVYRAVATKYNIPVHQELYTERESEHHIWIPGVDKPSPLKSHQLNMVLSQITVLDYIIVNLLGNSTCPYFHQLRDQLTAEILKPDYRDDVQAYFNTTFKSYLFEYTTKSAYLDSLKHIHEIESELRSLLSNVCTTNYSKRYTKSVINLDELTRPFMLYTKCLKLFESRSTRILPDFIYNTRREGATHIVEKLADSNYLITYDQYLDIFQYMNNESIILPRNYANDFSVELKYLINIIEDNMNPYKINFNNIRANSFYSSVAKGNDIIANILQAISMRQLDYNDKKYTVLEDFINVNFDKITVKLTVNDNYKINSEEYTKITQNGLNAAIEFHEIISKVNNA